tara:strand:+ start:552 stop:695 length:144 start_codon:yes stop_codon:yes gene_type:complete
VRRGEEEVKKRREVMKMTKKRQRRSDVFKCNTDNHLIVDFIGKQWFR